MDGNPSFTTLLNSIQALGRGFDVTSDIRLLYCKGIHRGRLVQIDELNTRDLVFSDSLRVPGVSVDIGFRHGNSGRCATPVYSFHEMAEYFNKMTGIYGSTPLGSFNAMFNFSGSSQVDDTATKALAMDGFFISLFLVKLEKPDLVLQEDVKSAVPNTWEPSSLASFIETFGTHVITSATIGGRDVVYVKQHYSSLLSCSEISIYIKEIGDQRFSDFESQHSTSQLRSRYETSSAADQFIFTRQEVHPQPSSAHCLNSKEDVTVIFRRRGGDDLVQSHVKWEKTVYSSPDVINMTFLPISSFLDGIAGGKHLARAIELYLECKNLVQPGRVLCIVSIFVD